MTDRIIEANITHASFIVDILNESYRSGEGWTSERSLVAGDRASLSSINQELLTGYRYYLLVRNSEYVGCFNIMAKENKAEIGGLAVRPKYQSLGIGQHLLNQAEKMAQTMTGIKTLCVHVLEPREELISFYTRQGYSRTHTPYPYPIARDSGRPIGSNLRVVVLSKKLRALTLNERTL